MKQKKPSMTQLVGTMIALCLALLVFTYKSSSGAADLQNVYQNLELFSNVLNEIQKNYVDEVDTQEVIKGAIKGMLMTLDPHSSFMDPEDFKEMKMETQGSFTGIGTEITIKDGILTIVSPIEGTPADKQGLQAGDRIMKIEGESTQDMSLMDAVKKLRGPKGSKVTISVHREGWTDLKEIILVRDIIPLISVKSSLLEPGYGYVRVTNFQSNTTKDLKKALNELNKPVLNGLILDLRNNPGGLLDQAVKVSDLFIEEGMIVSTRGRLSDQSMEFNAHRNGEDYTAPIIVLVNSGSASASEIVAGALQDHKRALVLGTQSFGKGSVQTIIPMANGAGLRLTTAKYYTPNGTSIQAKGIVPDIIVPFQPTEEKKDDKTNHNALREKDLKHHLENDNTPDKAKDSTPEEMSGAEESSDLENQMQEKLKKDNQLNTALLILKGLNVLNVKGSN